MQELGPDPIFVEPHAPFDTIFTVPRPVRYRARRFRLNKGNLGRQKCLAAYLINLGSFPDLVDMIENFA